MEIHIFGTTYDLIFMISRSAVGMYFNISLIYTTSKSNICKTAIQFWGICSIVAYCCRFHFEKVNRIYFCLTHFYKLKTKTKQTNNSLASPLIYQGALKSKKVQFKESYRLSQRLPFQIDLVWTWFEVLSFLGGLGGSRFSFGGQT